MAENAFILSPSTQTLSDTVKLSLAQPKSPPHHGIAVGNSQTPQCL